MMGTIGKGTELEGRDVCEYTGRGDASCIQVERDRTGI